MAWQLYQGDCLEVLKQYPDNYFDSVVTDPPYELGFMGKKWDSTGIAYNIELWQEVLRVLKPGGHLLAFGGTRTYHRMACAIEDAGFEIRDQIQWIYGSGFPKSLDISKAIDKMAGAEREVIGNATDRRGDGTVYAIGHSGRLTSNMPITKEAKQWQGWGTALKPANEPIVLARKPLSEKTVAENVLKWGTGGLNIDGCRVGWKDERDRKNGWRASPSNDDENEYTSFKSGSFGEQNERGRFPANVILDEEAGRMLDEQSGISKPRKGRTGKRGGTAWHGQKGIGTPDKIGRWPSDSGGGASRFFYCAKASKKERGEGNIHPTVKPLSLIKYLITLVTPPGGICLDPFEGSGTHALACKELGFNYIGFELNPEYCKMAEKRIEPYLMQQIIFELLKGGHR